MKQNMLLFVAGLLLMSFAEDKPAYRIYNIKGKDISYSKMLEALEGADVILFGEQHDNPISHWLQRELCGDLYAISQDLLLGAEMFERDNQLLIEEYLGGIISESSFESEARLWKNYKTDYKPLLQFALNHKLPFIATNVPRRYASLVYREGFERLDSLSAEARELLPPLPIKYDPDLPGYKKLFEMGHSEDSVSNANFPKAQAIKDATMGYFIFQNYTAGKQFLHFNGAGHSDNFEGIVWYLRQEDPDLKIITISTVLQENLDELEESNSDKADFTILVPERMTKTY